MTSHCVVSLQVSSGAIEEARTNLDQMLRHCAQPLSKEDDENEEMRNAREKSLHDVAHELVKQVTSPNKLVREEVRGRWSRTTSMCSLYLMLWFWMSGDVTQQVGARGGERALVTHNQHVFVVFNALVLDVRR